MAVVIVLVGAVEVVVEPATVGAGRVTPGRITMGFMTAEVVPSGLFGCLTSRHLLSRARNFVRR